MRSATCMTSPSLWVMMRTDLPSLAIWRRASNRASASWGVSTAVGSSKIRTSAPLTSSFNISTRCCSPMESCWMVAAGSTARWNRSAYSATWAFIRFLFRKKPHFPA